MTQISDDYSRRADRLPMFVCERLEFVSPLGRTVTVMFRSEKVMCVMSDGENFEIYLGGGRADG